MKETPYIVDVPLPPEQDFKTLKQVGIDFVSKHAGEDWTNLNNSDPGITILDQVCFAMSELGYCTSFPLPDFLTGIDEKIITEKQFYWPDQILTTSPVTVRDYVLFLTDEVEEVSNAVIIPIQELGLAVYQAYIQLKEGQNSKKIADDVCSACYYSLNKCRNIHEIFLRPIALERVSVFLVGHLTIEAITGLADVLDRLQQSFDNYIFPSIRRKGFDELSEAGIETEEIVNGPSMKSGWAEPGGKKDHVQIIELNYLLGGLEAEITALKIDGDDHISDNVSVALHQLIKVDIWGSLRAGLFSINTKHQQLSPADILSVQPLKSSFLNDPGIDAGVLNNKLRELPSGTYRDLSNYYSIQNTFPEIFAAGADAVTSNASQYEIARSRQLKAYLTLFDQVLANQFEQLSSIDILFSFSNSATRTKAGENAYQQSKKQVNAIYPFPYKSFSPTYFCQSLYHVPHIKPLLKDHDVFDFATATYSLQEQEKKSWEAYQGDPYNSYMHGLLQCVDDEEINLGRRNKILDHLLARHGESPLFIETVIEGAEYTGEVLKDKVIIKSLLLQNLGRLSYYRAKAMNFLAADPIDENLPRRKTYYQRLLHQRKDIGGIEASNEISERDLVNFSQVELRMNLLFGLKTQYDNYILENPSHENESMMAEWLTHQRRGSVVMETSLINYFLKREEDYFKGADLLVFFPSFIPHFITKGFQLRLEYFLEQSLPLGISYQCFFMEASVMMQLIPVFANWMNAIGDRSYGSVPRAEEASRRLIKLIRSVQ